MSPATTGFDRVRPRVPGSRTPVRPPDPQGRRALYSEVVQPPPRGVVTVDCSSCGETSATTPAGLLALAVPSLHLPLLRRGHSSWMRCPACGRRTWVKLGIRL